MLNPAGARCSLIGAAHESFLERFATAAGERDQERVVVVQGVDGGDELPLAPTPVVEYHQGAIEKYTLAPGDFGLKEAKHHPCETPAESARLIEMSLLGEDSPHLDALVFNAGVRIQLGGRVDSIEEGIALARDLISTGATMEKLQELRG